jgi:hypothetical protein
MKKIPTLFERRFEGKKIVEVLPTVKDGLEWVLEGKGVATIKLDGSCTAIINGEFYKRYDAKGKTPPEGAIPCDEPDPITGHHPHWVKVDENDPSDKWFARAFNNLKANGIALDGTYEAVGVHFQGNPYNLSDDYLFRHGTYIVDVDRTFEGIRDFLTNNEVEGLVFWLGGEPKCKIKRSDFGLSWNNNKKKKL